MATSYTPETSLRPTRKWIAALVTGLLLIAIHTGASGGWDTTEWGELGSLVTALSASYVVRNDATPGGVPLKSS